MIERLFSYAILLKCELITLDKYNDYLNEMFLQDLDNRFLLELQLCSSDILKTIVTIMDYSGKVDIDYDVFGKFLLYELNTIYPEMEIHNFGAKAYSLWNLLPKNIEQKQPFWTLSYADDPLSWGDEKQSRELYEKMFKYYENYDKS